MSKIETIRKKLRGGRNESLYAVHCQTFKIAREIAGYFVENPLVTKGSIRSGLATFRAFPGYRTSAAKELRNEVCTVVRFNQAIKRFDNFQKSGSLFT